MSKYNVGQIIGKYKLIKQVKGDKWSCKCLGKEQGSLNCEGKERNLHLYNLGKSLTKSCGCVGKDNREKEYLGKTFGDLTITKIYRKINNEGHSRIFGEADCICGNKWRGYLANVVTESHCRSCGCRATRNKYKSREKGSGGFNKSCRSVKNSADCRNLELNLSKEQLRIIFESNCIYCNRRPSYLTEITKTSHEESKKYHEYVRSTVDRVDSKKGYIIGNVVPSCKMCNYAKWDYSLDYFLEWINQTFKKVISKEEFNKKLDDLTKKLEEIK